MKQISVRELRQYASVWLRRVQAGETFEITSRGRPVAVLAPPPPEDELEQLIASGRVRPARGDLLELLKRQPPLDPRPDLSLPSKVLEDMRADES